MAGFFGQPLGIAFTDLRTQVQTNINDAMRSTYGSNQGKPTACAFVLEEDPRGSRVEFESFPEEGIIEGYAATMKNIADGFVPQPASRMYTGGDWNQLVFDLEFRAGDIQGGHSERDLNSLSSKMEKKLRLLQAMSFPKPPQRRAPNAKAIPSSWRLPLVLLILGDFITYRGYVESTEITWKTPFVPSTVRPLAASVTVTFLPTMAIFPDFFDVQDPNLRGSTVDVVNALVAQGASREDTLTLADRQRKRQEAEFKAKIADLLKQHFDGTITQAQLHFSIAEFKDVKGASGTPIPSGGR